MLLPDKLKTKITHYIAMPKVVVVGIINCTPDSFSDGIDSIDAPSPAATARATSTILDNAKALIDAGAEMLDVGGDSTRPGSHCTDDEREWNRIEPVLSYFCHRVPVSVDTHKAEIARRSLALGASMINDITGGINAHLVETVANSPALYTYMFNAYGAAHQFHEPKTFVSLETIISTISTWATERTRTLAAQGISIARQVVDPGLGRFVSPDPTVSCRIIDDFWKIESPATSRMLGCSRKGFLRQPHETSPADRDDISATVGAKVAAAAPADATLYLRVHNASAQRRALLNLPKPNAGR